MRLTKPHLPHRFRQEPIVIRDPSGIEWYQEVETQSVIEDYHSNSSGFGSYFVAGSSLEVKIESFEGGFGC